MTSDESELDEEAAGTCFSLSIQHKDRQHATKELVKGAQQRVEYHQVQSEREAWYLRQWLRTIQFVAAISCPVWIGPWLSKTVVMDEARALTVDFRQRCGRLGGFPLAVR